LPLHHLIDFFRVTRVGPYVLNAGATPKVSEAEGRPFGFRHESHHGTGQMT
jgi:hypothetical protein